MSSAQALSPQTTFKGQIKIWAIDAEKDIGAPSDLLSVDGASDRQQLRQTL